MPSVPSFIPSADSLPHGLDRADGLGGRLGTRTPAGAVSFDSPNGKNTSPTIEEDPTSPTMERAEQCTVRKSYTGAYDEMLNRWTVYPRGTLTVDSGYNFFRILSTTLSHMAGDRGRLDLVAEALSFDSPPDEFSCQTVNLGLDIMKNPRYFYALMPTAQIPTPWPAFLTADTAVQSAVKSTIIRAIQAYRENPLVPPQQVISNVSGYFHDLIISNFVTGNGNYAVPNPNYNPGFATTPPDKPGTLYSGSPFPPAAAAQGDKNPAVYYAAFKLGTTSDPNGNVALALAAAQELLTKIWRMEDSPPVYGLEVTHTEYWWRPPYINLGSYLEDPQAANPPVPDYFLCPSTIPDGTTMFDLIGDFNPQYYSQTGFAGGGVAISWLRQADQIEFCRTFFKVTRRWLGAPIGAFDKDLFNQLPRPTVPIDYRTVVLS